MRAKMKVINMQLYHSENMPTILPNSQEKTLYKMQQLAKSFQKILKEESLGKVQKIRNFVTEDKIHFFSKVVEYFLRCFCSRDKDQDKLKPFLEDENQRESLDKANRKLQQALIYIEHIKDGIKNKEKELRKKDQLIIGLRRECQLWKSKLKKQHILKELVEGSSQLLRRFQMSTSSCFKLPEFELNFEDPKQQPSNQIFYRTASDIDEMRSYLASSMNINAFNSPKRNYTTAGVQSDYTRTRKKLKAKQKRDKNRKIERIISEKKQEKWKQGCFNKQNQVIGNGINVVQKQLN